MKVISTDNLEAIITGLRAMVRETSEHSDRRAHAPPGISLRVGNYGGGVPASVRYWQIDLEPINGAQLESSIAPWKNDFLGSNVVDYAGIGVELLLPYELSYLRPTVVFPLETDDYETKLALASEITNALRRGQLGLGRSSTRDEAALCIRSSSRYDFYALPHMGDCEVDTVYFCADLDPAAPETLLNPHGTTANSKNIEDNKTLLVLSSSLDATVSLPKTVVVSKALRPVTADVATSVG